MFGGAEPGAAVASREVGCSWLGGLGLDGGTFQSSAKWRVVLVRSAPPPPGRQWSEAERERRESRESSLFPEREISMEHNSAENHREREGFRGQKVNKFAQICTHTQPLSLHQQKLTLPNLSDKADQHFLAWAIRPWPYKPNEKLSRANTYTRSKCPLPIRKNLSTQNHAYKGIREGTCWYVNPEPQYILFMKLRCSRCATRVYCTVGVVLPRRRVSY